MQFQSKTPYRHAASLKCALYAVTVQDLSEGHLSALDYAKAQGSHGGFSVFNLGE